MFSIKRERVRAVREEITATQFLVPTSAAWQNGTHLEQSRAILEQSDYIRDVYHHTHGLKRKNTAECCMLWCLLNETSPYPLADWNCPVTWDLHSRELTKHNKGEKWRNEGEESSKSNPSITFRVVDLSFNNNFSFAIQKRNRQQIVQHVMFSSHSWPQEQRVQLCHTKFITGSGSFIKWLQ